MSVFAATVPGADLLMDTSAEVPPLTTVVAVLLSFSGVGSVGSDVVAMLVRKVPGGVAGAICPTRVKFALVPAVNVAVVLQMTVPLVPTGGVVGQFQPAGGVTLTKVTPAGNGSDHCEFPAALSSGPRLVTVSV